MIDRTSVVDLQIIERQSEFFSLRMLMLSGLTVALFSAGLAMRHMSLNDPMPTYVAAGVLLLAVLSFLMLRILRQCSVRVDGEYFVVKTSDGTRRVALANLKPQAVRVLDLSRYCNFNIEAWPWPTTIPYSKNGSYPLPNGESAILLITDPTRVCRLRSYTDGVTFLLSLQNPENLLALFERALLETDADSTPVDISLPLRSTEARLKRSYRG